MSNENETMELETMEQPEEVCEVTTEEVETESKSSAGLVAIAIGGALATAGLVYAGVKKLKKAKDDKPKKPKMKWKLVRVPADTEGEIEGVDDSEEEFEDEE